MGKGSIPIHSKLTLTDVQKITEPFIENRTVATFIALSWVGDPRAKQTIEKRFDAKPTSTIVILDAPYILGMM